MPKLSLYNSNLSINWIGQSIPAKLAVVLSYHASSGHEPGLQFSFRRTREAKLFAPMTAFFFPTNEAPQMVPRISKIKERMKTCRVVSATYPMNKRNRFMPTFTTKVAEQNAGLVGEEDVHEDLKTLSQHKTKLFQEVNGMAIGIFSPFFFLNLAPLYNKRKTW